ncbi:MAG: AAA family ATPase [Deltaproteobacteria bacterium]|nr:AAA family ATPase [Deltaproteobacteria bacterium]
MYNSYFGFSASPFSVTPDPNFFYTNPVYEEAYANLRYGIEAKKGFIVITGEVGTGKTTLLRKLMMHNLKGNIHTVFVFNTYLNFTELLQVILYDLGLIPNESNNKVVLLQELNNYLIMQLEQGHIVSVLVDEAQNLSDEALEGLRLLSNVETDQEKLIQIVLMGQPELHAKLDRPSLRQLKQRVALQCRLVPLKNEEVGPYIDFRLRAVGYNGKDLFYPDAVRQITSYSKGIPRLVNIICDNSLLCAFGRSQKIISADVIHEVARDLRLGSEVKVTQTERTPGVVASKPEPETSSREAPNQVPRHKLKRMVKVGAETFLVVFGIVAVASLIDPRNFLTTAGRGLEIAKHNLNQWVLFITHQQAVPAKASAEVKVESKEQQVIVPRGSSIYKIASDTYGTNTALGMDLIKEFNPQIKSLGRVPAGWALLLPSLTPETLLRKQSDGSYHLIVASFHSLTGAGEYAGRLRKKGYQVTVTPKRVSDDLLLHRVAIDGLKTYEEARQTWLTGLRNEWLVLADPMDGTR